jgi:hypothetical protein
MRSAEPITCFIGAEQLTQRCAMMALRLTWLSGSAAGRLTGMPERGRGPGWGDPGCYGIDSVLRGARITGGPPDSGTGSYHYIDVHGAGAQRGDPKKPSNY